ncbi:MAG: ATP-binding protein [Thermodesulfobacteriota bacterium]
MSPFAASVRPAGREVWLRTAGPALAGAALVLAGGLAGPTLAALLAVPAGAGAWLWARRLRLRQERAAGLDLNERLIQSQKMAALGEIASGIAHEINTPLAVIGQIAEWQEHLLSSGAGGDAGVARELADTIAQIHAQVERCRDITHNMLAFSRRSDAIYQETDLARLLEDMLRLVEREHRSSDIVFLREHDTRLGPVLTDPQLLRQVALNLLNNAAQAVIRDGTVTVTTGLGQDGPFFSVRDTGRGIAPENLGRIFNPFFTTKPPGAGTGLGLSICLAIVTRLGGTIAVDSAPGKGACFTVHLPATQKPQAPEPERRQAP